MNTLRSRSQCEKKLPSLLSTSLFGTLKAIVSYGSAAITKYLNRQQDNDEHTKFKTKNVNHVLVLQIRNFLLLFVCRHHAVTRLHALFNVREIQLEENAVLSGRLVLLLRHFVTRSSDFRRFPWLHFRNLLRSRKRNVGCVFDSCA